MGPARRMRNTDCRVLRNRRAIYLFVVGIILFTITLTTHQLRRSSEELPQNYSWGVMLEVREHDGIAALASESSPTPEGTRPSQRQPLLVNVKVQAHLTPCKLAGIRLNWVKRSHVRLDVDQIAPVFGGQLTQRATEISEAFVREHIHSRGDDLARVLQSPVIVEWTVVRRFAIYCSLLPVCVGLLWFAKDLRNEHIRRRRRLSGQCQDCGYPSVMGDAPCPECGHRSHSEATAKPTSSELP
jgi:hypothetical protein